MLILRRLYSRQSSSAKYLKPVKVDPGILHQRKIIAGTQEDASEVDFDKLESDFMNIDKSHKEHVRDMEAWREKEKYLIVKRKYFTEKNLNFLMWHDKEQIRYLHDMDPEEWSIEKLSEAFPALPEVIEKIIKNKWTKSSQAKIASHDQSVTKHWRDFKRGKLNFLPDDLKEHLQKFSNRSSNLKPFETPTNKDKTISNLSENTKPGEFSEIITSYQKLQSEIGNKNKIEDHHSAPKYLGRTCASSDNEITTLQHKAVKNDGTLLTFKELQQRVERKIAQGKDVSEQDKLIVKETNLPSKENLVTTVVLQAEEISNIVGHRQETNSDKVGFVRKTSRDMSHLIYPERIAIPKKCYKKGFTYKLNDCYYDSDGEFLYRVPGMS